MSACTNSRVTGSGVPVKAPMDWDPADRSAQPWPSSPDAWRYYNAGTAWLFNPWTGERRDARDVGSDPWGQLIQAPAIDGRPPGLYPLVAAREQACSNPNYPINRKP